MSGLASKRGLGCYESLGGWEVERAKDLWDEVFQLTFTYIAVGFHFHFFKQKKIRKNLYFSSHFRQTFFKHVYIHVLCKFEHRIQEQAVRVEQECVVAAAGKLRIGP